LSDEAQCGLLGIDIVALDVGVEETNLAVCVSEVVGGGRNGKGWLLQPTHAIRSVVIFHSK
jgi:hypothetical protein